MFTGRVTEIGVVIDPPGPTLTARRWGLPMVAIDDLRAHF